MLELKYKKGRLRNGSYSSFLSESCRSDSVKSFGRRQAYEVAEEGTRGPQSMTMGISIFG